VLEAPTSEGAAVVVGVLWEVDDPTGADEVVVVVALVTGGVELDVAATTTTRRVRVIGVCSICSLNTCWKDV